MAGNGPPPNPNAVRRNSRVGMVTLPAGGRRGRTPKWPLPDNPRLTARINMLQDAIDQLEEQEHVEGKLTRTERTALTRKRESLGIAEEERRVIRETEQELWTQLWHTPQAQEWDRLRWTREVAQYVRWKAAAECGDLDAGRESRQYADRLGLSPKGMRSLMWVIAPDEVQERREAKKANETATERRRHIKAVEDTGS